MAPNSPKSPVALISGANRGIGSSIARELHAAGYSLSLGARCVASLENAHGPETADCLHCLFDAQDKDGAAAWVERTLKRFQRIDVLVNNAGSAERISLLDDNEEGLDRLWEINVKAPLRMTRLCLPHLAKSGRGRIINIASLSGKRARNAYVGYNMTKFAMLGLSHTTRHVAWDQGVRVTAVCPSFVKTDMTADVTRIDRDEMIDPDTLAGLVRHVIELPNNAAIAELLVNCLKEDML